MVTMPVLGKTYWMVVDAWEQIAAVPVVLIAEQDGTFTARWNITEDYHEDYDGTEPGQLYQSEFCALAEIKRIRAAEREGAAHIGGDNCERSKEGASH